MGSQIFSKMEWQKSACQCGLNKGVHGFLYLYSRLEPQEKGKGDSQGTMCDGASEKKKQRSLVRDQKGCHVVLTKSLHSFE